MRTNTLNTILVLLIAVAVFGSIFLWSKINISNTINSKYDKAAYYLPSKELTMEVVGDSITLAVGNDSRKYKQADLDLTELNLATFAKVGNQILLSGDAGCVYVVVYTSKEKSHDVVKLACATEIPAQALAKLQSIN